MSTSNDICFRPPCQLELISRSLSLLLRSQAVLSPQTPCCKTTTLPCNKFSKQADRIDCEVLAVSRLPLNVYSGAVYRRSFKCKSSILSPQRNSVLIKLVRILQTASWVVARYKDAGLKAMGNLKQQSYVKSYVWRTLKINE